MGRRRETLEQSLGDGRGLEVARYAVVLVGLALPITAIVIANHASRLAVALAISGGFLLAVAAYAVITRIVIAKRMAKLHAIRGIDAPAADAMLDRSFRNATLTVRARFVGDRPAVCAQIRKLPRIADARIEADDVVVVTEYLRTRSNTVGIGSRTRFTNWTVYCAVMEIADIVPTCERFTIELAGDPARAD